MRLSHMMPKSAEEEEEGVRVTGFTPSVESHTLQHGRVWYHVSHIAQLVE